MVVMFIDMDYDHKLEILGFRSYGFWTDSGILELVAESLIPSGEEPLGSNRKIFKCGSTWTFVSKDKRIHGFWLCYQSRLTQNSVNWSIVIRE